MARHVKTIGAALAKTTTPVVGRDGLENVVSGLGTTHDKRFFTTWAMPRTLQRHELENMYRGS